jgi:hypothetical protein
MTESATAHDSAFVPYNLLYLKDVAPQWRSGFQPRRIVENRQLALTHA